ncbi:MAG: bifunctional UDP-N-acetylglucosamine diphosphorylase/glucosamine-1-phosphate N-acetyltransferase GlmU [Pseudomonadota bacterium]
MTDIASVILAAGHGSRMKSATPKVLHEIGRRSMLHHVMAMGAELGAIRQVVVVGTGGEQVSAAARAFDPDVSIAVQDPPQGTGHAVQMALPALEGFEGTVLVLYADTPMMKAGTAYSLIDVVTKGAALSVLGFETGTLGAYGRLIENASGELDRIVEYKDANEAERAVTLCNAGLMAVSAATLRKHLPHLSNENAQGEYYLTDLPGMVRETGGRCAIVRAGMDETSGVNTRAELAAAEAVFQARRRNDAMVAGATLHDPETVWFSHDTQIGEDVAIGQNVVFGPGVTVESGATIEAFCHLEGAHVRSGATVGPYARLRPGTSVGEGAKIGNFVETKKAVLGEGAKVSHLTYLGDTDVGAKANIGAGTITCNYDGYDKFKTVIGEGAFVGSNSSLVAPVKIGRGAYVGSGSVVTKSVPDDALSVARAKQFTKSGWAASFRQRKTSKDQE